MLLQDCLGWDMSAQGLAHNGLWERPVDWTGSYEAKAWFFIQSSLTSLNAKCGWEKELIYRMMWNGDVFLVCERGQSMFSCGINNKEKIFYDYVICPLKVLRSHNFQWMSSKWTHHHGDPKVIPMKLSKYMPSLWCMLGLPCQGGPSSVFLFISSHLRGVDRS